MRRRHIGNAHGLPLGGVKLYLNCPSCHLTVYSAGAMTYEECPRCAARLGRAVSLFRSPLPARLMASAEVGARRMKVDPRASAATRTLAG